MPKCLEWGEERHQECTEWRDEGHNECSDWDDECCDWWPCSWGCKIITWICVGWYWVASWVCIGWTWITTAVCLVWDVVTTVINAILVTIESILGWILDGLAFIIELLEMIPILGTLIRWVLNFVTFLIWTFVSIVDAILGFIGIRPEKLLRVCTVILSDEKGNPVASTDYAVALLQLAANVYKRDANVRIVPLAPFHYSSGFGDAETVSSDWVKTESGSSDADVLDIPCGADGAGADWGLVGSKLQFKSSTHCFFGAWRRVLGYGAPVTCFIIRSIPGQSGCCLWITDFATMQGGFTLPPFNPRVLGHESGHACNLGHTCVDDDVRNMMGTGDECDPDSTTTPNYADPRMNNWQVIRVRASKHVTYF
jgi:hypothetical protein